MDKYASFTDFHNAELVAWSISARLVAMTFFISLSSIHTQLLPLCGSKYGITPVKDVMDRIKIDYPSLTRRFLYFPTVFWFTGKINDNKLLILNRIGILASAVGMAGSNSQLTWSFSMFVSLTSLLSLDIALDLSYPWDCLLFEAGWLALFLPFPQFIWDNFEVVEKPSELLSFLFRLLLFRVVFGFGKLKFVGHTARDNGYIKGFLIYQPIPSIFGWLGEKLPVLFHKLALAGMFFIEIIAPFFLLFPITNTFPFRPVAAASFIALMFGIQLCGNFGHFNVLTIGLSIPFLYETTVTASPSTTLWLLHNNSYGDIILCIFAVCVIFPLSFAMLPFNSWVSQVWVWWPALSPHAMKNTFLRSYAKFIRVLAPFRICHSYGVFECRPGPTIRWVPVVIGSIDNGKNWVEFEYKYAASKETSMPKFVAPHHPRLDHQLIYEGLGYDVVSCANLGHSASTRNPYRFTKTTAIERLVMRMLDPACYSHMIRTFFKEDPFRGTVTEMERQAQLHLQIVLVALEPCTIKDSSVNRTWDKSRKQFASPIKRSLMESDDFGISLLKRKYWKRHFVHVHSSKDMNQNSNKSQKLLKSNSMYRLEHTRSNMKAWLSGGVGIPHTPDYFHIDSCITRDETALGKYLRCMLHETSSLIDSSKIKSIFFQNNLKQTFYDFNSIDVGEKFMEEFFNCTKRIRNWIILAHTHTGSWCKQDISTLSYDCLNELRSIGMLPEIFELVFLRLRWVLLLKHQHLWFSKSNINDVPIRKLCPSYFEFGLLIELFLINYTKKEDYLEVIFGGSNSFQKILNRCFYQYDSLCFGKKQFVIQITEWHNISFGLNKSEGDDWEWSWLNDDGTFFNKLLEDYMYGYAQYLSNKRKFRNNKDNVFWCSVNGPTEEDYWQYYGLIFHAMFNKSHLETAAKKFRISRAIHESRLASEKSMTEATVDSSGTVPGWLSLAPLMQHQYTNVDDEGEQYPRIEQDNADGLVWTVDWG